MGPDVERPQAFLAPEGVPLHVWVAPLALPICPESILDRLPEGSSWLAVPDGDPPLSRRPALLVLAAEDLTGPHRVTLLRLAELARPGRPVVVGGTRDKERLLDAINIWRASRLVPRDTVPNLSDRLVEALEGAHQALDIQHAIARGAAELRHRCQRLGHTVGEIRATRQQLLHAERLSTVARITGSLTRMVQRQVELMQRFDRAMSRHVEDPALADMLSGALEGTCAIRASLEDMQALTEDRQEGRFAPTVTDVDELARRAGALFALDPGLKERQFVLDCESDLQLSLDRHRTLHVLLNLLRNALQATKPGQSITLRTARDDDRGIIEVEDTGCGIVDSVQHLVFKQFFSTKGPEGMGLGLSMCQSVVERQGGRLTVSSTPGQGSCFRISLPLTPPPTEPAER